MANQFYLIPSWFFGYDIALELLFAVITALVAFFSVKIYNICNERECKLLAWAFGSISLSYFLLATLNLLAATSQVDNSVITIALRNIVTPSSVWIYAYIFFFISGLSILAYLSFNVVNQRLFALIASLSLVVIVFSTRAGIAFNFVAAILLFYVVLFYLDKYKSSGSRKILFVLVAFVLLLFARLSFAFSSINPIPYVADHVIELIAYGLILISLIKTVKK